MRSGAFHSCGTAQFFSLLPSILLSLRSVMRTLMLWCLATAHCHAAQLLSVLRHQHFTCFPSNFCDSTSKNFAV